jgi:hypothetical protein
VTLESSAGGVVTMAAVVIAIVVIVVVVWLAVWLVEFIFSAVGQLFDTVASGVVTVVAAAWPALVAVLLGVIAYRLVNGQFQRDNSLLNRWQAARRPPREATREGLTFHASQSEPSPPQTRTSSPRPTISSTSGATSGGAKPPASWPRRSRSTA